MAGEITGDIKQERMEASGREVTVQQRKADRQPPQTTLSTITYCEPTLGREPEDLMPFPAAGLDRLGGEDK